MLRLRKLRHIDRVAGDLVTVEAGCSHATITRFCVERGLAGLEFGAGIAVPGLQTVASAFSFHLLASVPAMEGDDEAVLEVVIRVNAFGTEWAEADLAAVAAAIKNTAQLGGATLHDGTRCMPMLRRDARAMSREICGPMLREHRRQCRRRWADAG